MTDLDYAKRTAQLIGLDPVEQMANNLKTAVFIDVSWKKAALETLGEEKAMALDCRTWSSMAKISTQAAMDAKCLDIIPDFETLKDIVVAQLANFMIPTEITENNSNRLVIELLSCPFPTYAIPLLGVQTGDWICKSWTEETRHFLNTVLETGGMLGSIHAFVDRSICMGDRRCVFRFEKINPTGSPAKSGSRIE